MDKRSQEQHIRLLRRWLAQLAIRMEQETDRQPLILQINEVESLLVRMIWVERQQAESQQQYLAQLELCLGLLSEMKGSL